MSDSRYNLFSELKACIDNITRAYANGAECMTLNENNRDTLKAQCTPYAKIALNANNSCKIGVDEFEKTTKKGQGSALMSCIEESAGAYGDQGAACAFNEKAPGCAANIFTAEFKRKSCLGIVDELEKNYLKEQGSTGMKPNKL